MKDKVLKYYYIIYTNEWALKEIRRVDTLAQVKATIREWRIYGNKNLSLYPVKVLYYYEEGVIWYKWYRSLEKYLDKYMIDEVYNNLEYMIKNYQKFLKKQLTNN